MQGLEKAQIKLFFIDKLSQKFSQSQQPLSITFLLNLIGIKRTRQQMCSRKLKIEKRIRLVNDNEKQLRA